MLGTLYQDISELKSLQKFDGSHTKLRWLLVAYLLLHIAFVGGYLGVKMFATFTN